MSPRIPPGPTVPRLLNLVKWMRDPAPLLESCRKQYGDVWLLRLMAETDFVFVSDPRLVEQVFAADPDVLQAGTAHRRIGTALLGEDSLLMLDEPEHMYMKELMMPSFHGERLKRYREGMEQLAHEEIDSWPLHQPVEMLPRMRAIALNAIMTIVFGVSRGARWDSLQGRIHDLLEFADNPMRMMHLHLTHRRGRELPQMFVRVRDALDVELFEVIEETRR